MPRIEKVISRGIAGAELAALAVARLHGVATGGHTRIFNGKKSSSTILRYGLVADPCSRRQAIRRNIRRADGTLVIGRFGKELEATLGSQRSHFFCLELLNEESALRAGQWLERHGVRVLNVMGPTDRVSEEWARILLCDLLRRQGRRALLPAEATGLPRPVVLAARDTCYAVVPWPIPRAWHWHEAREIWTVVKDWKSLRILRRSTPSSSWVTRPFWEAVPPQVRQWVTQTWEPVYPSDEHWITHDLEMMEVFGRLGKPAADLARAGRWAVLRLLSEAGSPALDASAAAQAWDAAAKLLTGRQRDLLGYFGFPATESAVRVLAKVPPRGCGAQLVHQLRALLWDPDAQGLLQRLPRVNHAVVDVLSDPWLRRIVGWRLLRRLATPPGEDNYWLITFLSTEADRTGRRDQIGRIDSIKSLDRIVTDLQARPDAGRLPPPPALPGIDGVIEPLLDGASLAMEGRFMRHCAGQHCHDVVRGHGLMFRILPNGPCGTERATLELRPAADGLWRVAQLNGASNALVGPGTHRFVETWLFFAHCDPTATSEELRRACVAELAVASQSGRAQAA